MSYTAGIYTQKVDEVKACARTLEASVGGVRARVGGSSELADLFAAGVGECRWTQGKSCVVKNEKERTIDGPLPETGLKSRHHEQSRKRDGSDLLEDNRGNGRGNCQREGAHNEQRRCGLCRQCRSMLRPDSRCWRNFL